MWLTLIIIAAVVLLLSWGGPNAVWGGATIGFIGGLIAASIYYFRGAGFQWSVVGKWMVIASLFGFALELPKLLKRWRK